MMEIKPRPRRTLPERSVLIQSGELCLEGLYIKKESTSLPVLLNAPHPQFGGSMDSPVINELAYALSHQGIASLRFNYRGVGASQGTFDNGIGERKDMEASMEFLIETFYPEKRGKIAVGGFSFGSSIGFEQAKVDQRIERLLLVAPPILKYDFSALPQLSVPVGILVGAKDTFCPLRELNDFIHQLAEKNPNWTPPPICAIPHASHYFVRGLPEAGRASAHFLITGAFPENLEEEK